MTTAHHGLPLGRWYCTISFFFLGFANTAGLFLLGCAPPRTPIMPGLVTLVLIVRELSQVVAALFDFCVFLFVWMNVPWVFLTLPACSLI